jgi:transposase
MNSAAYVKEKTPRNLRPEQQRAFIYIVITRDSTVYRADGRPILLLTCNTVWRHNFKYETGWPMPTKSKNESPKVKALVEEGTLNPNPEKVRDPRFQHNEFFDPRDLVQVRYEMLRRVSIENASVTDATEEYGVSRPTYYQARTNFDKRGVAGLVPQKRGPRGPHKLQGKVLTFVEQQLVAGEPVRARELARSIQQEFGLHIHPRTIERAVAGKKTPR